MAIPELTPILNQFKMQLDVVSAAELVSALAIPLLAILLKLRVERYIKSRDKASFGMTFFDFATPLISPVIAILLSMVAIATFRAFEVESLLLLFAVKACLAWFAISLVVLLSSKQIAGWFIALVIVPVTLLQLFGIWDDTIEALTALQFKIGTVQLNAFLIFKGVFAIVTLQWIAGISVHAVDRKLNRMHNMRASNRTLILKIFQIVLYCMILVIGMQMLGINMSVLGVFGGAVGVGIGFGLQKIASNFISGIILLFEKSIEIGDLVQFSDGTLGYVRQTYARYTRLEMSDGKEVMIPNEEFITQRVISWTHTDTKARVEIILRLVYSADVALAQQLMLKAATDHPSRMVDTDPICYVTNFTDTGVEMTLYFWVPNVRDGRMRPRSEVMLNILQAFKDHDITIFMVPPVAHPTPALPEPEKKAPAAKAKASANKSGSSK